MCEGAQVISLLSMATAAAVMDPQNSLLWFLPAHAHVKQYCIAEDMLKAVAAVARAAAPPRTVQYRTRRKYKGSCGSISTAAVATERVGS